MSTSRLHLFTAFVGVVASLIVVAAQDDGFDPVAVALTYHKVSGEPFDFERAAEQTEAVRRASGFDRPAVIKAQVARLQQQFAAANAATEFIISVQDTLQQYDHDEGAFPIGLFTPGHYIPLTAFVQSYSLVFANADRSRLLPMPKEQARDFDARMNAMGRQLTDEIRFRVVGKGDPSGAIADGNVIRAEIVSVRVLDRSGNVLYTPDMKKVSASEASAASFDAGKVDIAGLRLGVAASDLEATLQRLYGKVTRGKAAGYGWAKFTGSLEVNSSGCYSVYGRRGNPRPGAACLTAAFDDEEIVRLIRIERLFYPFEPDVLRKALLKKYGAVSASRTGTQWGWGPDVEGAWRALSANWSTDTQMFDDAMGRTPNMKVTLQLVDPVWAAAHR